jgi:hypothetical protein
MSAVIDLGVYGADGFTIEMDQTKRDTIPSIEPSLNHTTIGRLAENINDYELVVHPGDFAYADDVSINGFFVSHLKLRFSLYSGSSPGLCFLRILSMSRDLLSLTFIPKAHPKWK